MNPTILTRYIKLLLFTFFILSRSVVFSQLNINNTFTPTYLVNNVLLGSGLTATNITFTGDSRQIGYFNGSASNIGINDGIILSTGVIHDAIGPNNTPSSGILGLNTGIKDSDLDIIANTNSNSFDVASLEFDFVATGDSVNFSFIFASEEYLEFVNAGVNDAFGFFLSGPGISGPFSNSSINLAKIPGTNNNITIDDINANINSMYYIDNGDGSSGTQFSDPTVVQFDGFTTKLTAAYQLQCGQTYHIKISVGDIGDEIYNSAVFIEANSFTIPNQTTVEAFLSASKDSICAGDSVLLTATNTNGKSFILNNGLPNAPGNHWIHPTTSTQYEFIVIDTNFCGIEVRDTATITVSIKSTLNFDFEAFPVSGCNPLTVDFNNLSPDTNYRWEWIFGDLHTSNATSPQNIYTDTGVYDVTLIGTLGGCTDTITKTNYINVVDKITANFDTKQLLGCSPLVVDFDNLSSGTDYDWAWDFGDNTSNDNFSPQHIYASPGTFDVTLIASNNGCIDTITIPNLVNVIETPTADFNYSVSGDIGISTTVNFMDLSHNQSACVWNLGNGSSSTLPNPSSIYPEGEYEVTLVVSNRNMCFDTLTKRLKFEEINHFIPNSFTPNNDGVNDVFKPVISGSETYQLMIFNRWGEIIFETNDPNVGWDGKTRANTQSQIEVYTWEIKYTTSENPKIERLFGHINLIR